MPKQTPKPATKETLKEISAPVLDHALNFDRWVELEVYGLVVGPYQARPLLLLKDKEMGNVLPVGITELEAQILASGSDRLEGPHGVTFSFLKSQGMKLSKACFQEVHSNRQLLRVYFTGQNENEISVVECFAENAMSICLGAKAPIYASLGFIEQCRRTPLDFSLAEAQNFTRDKIPPHLVQ